MSNTCKVKIFESCGFTELEAQINKWLDDTGNKYIESIAYSAGRDAYSALVYYHLLPPPIEDEHRTEPLP
jgi:hypothetical protein